MNIPAKYKNSKYVQGLAKAKTAAVKRASNERKNRRSTMATAMATFAGGAGAGVVRKKMPEVAGVPTDALLGFALGVLGVFAGQPAVAEAGVGMLVPTVADYVEDMTP